MTKTIISIIAAVVALAAAAAAAYLFITKFIRPKCCGADFDDYLDCCCCEDDLDELKIADTEISE